MGGCLSRKTGGFNPEKDLMDLTGKVALVTGGNTGIGYHTVKFLARKGATVYLGARNEAKARAAMAELEKDGIGRGQVVFLNVNFSDPRWAKAAAEEFLTKESRLDILVNNAAQLTGQYEESPDGINTLMVINHFSPFVFTRTLLPLMTETSKKPGSDVRIVTVGSVAHTQNRPADPKIKFSALEDFNHEFASDFYPDWSRYAVSKLVNILFARELQKKLDQVQIPILSIPIHPGEVNTFADRLPWPFLANIAMELFFMRPEPGSYTSCFAAASSLVRNFPAKYKNTYLEPVGRIGDLSSNAKRDDLASDLWKTTEELLEGMAIKIPPV